MKKIIWVVGIASVIFGSAAMALPILNHPVQCYGLKKCQQNPNQCSGSKKTGYYVVMKKRACERAGGLMKK